MEHKKDYTVIFIINCPVEKDKEGYTKLHGTVNELLKANVIQGDCDTICKILLSKDKSDVMDVNKIEHYTFATGEYNSQTSTGDKIKLLRIQCGWIKDIPESVVVPEFVGKYNYDLTMKCNPGGIGLYCSAMHVNELIVRNQWENSIIFEDKIWLYKDFWNKIKQYRLELPEDYDVLSLGTSGLYRKNEDMFYYDYTRDDTLIKPISRELSKVECCISGTYSYMISLKGTQKLLHAKPWVENLDLAKRNYFNLLLTKTKDITTNGSHDFYWWCNSSKNLDVYIVDMDIISYYNKHESTLNPISEYTDERRKSIWGAGIVYFNRPGVNSVLTKSRKVCLDKQQKYIHFYYQTLNHLDKKISSVDKFKHILKTIYQDEKLDLRTPYNLNAIDNNLEKHLPDKIQNLLQLERNTINKICIPLIIHQIWCGGEMPEHKVLWTNSIKQFAHQNGFQYRIWGNDDLNEENFPQMYKFIDRARQMNGQPVIDNPKKKYGKWAQIADLMRTELIYRYGGFYFDTNLEILKTNAYEFASIMRNVDNQYIFCNEDPCEPTTENCNYLSTSFFGGVRGNKFCKILLDDYVRLGLNKVLDSPDSSLTTGPQKWGITLSIPENKHFLKKFTFLNTEKLYPYIDWDTHFRQKDMDKCVYYDDTITTTKDYYPLSSLPKTINPNTLIDVEFRGSKLKLIYPCPFYKNSYAVNHWCAGKSWWSGVF